MRDPWFRIIEVREAGGRSMADIAREAADAFGVRLADLMGKRKHPVSRKARRSALNAIRLERTDLSSTQVAMFFDVEASTVRHVWRRLELEAA